MTISCPKTTQHFRKLLHISRCLALVIMILVGAGSGVRGATYNLVTSTSDLVAGAKYLVVSTQTVGSGKALGLQNANNRAEVAITVLSGSPVSINATPSTTSSDTKPFELTLGGSSGAWTLYDAVNANYLRAESSSSNYLKLGTTSNWTITFSSNAAVMTSLYNSVSNKILRHNSTSNLFSCYSGGQNSVYLYKLTSSTPTLSVSPLTDFGNICTNTTAGPNSFTITGSNLTSANVTVGALSGFTYSTTSGGTYTSTLNLTQPGGAYSQTIYVKFTPTAVQSYNGNIAIGGGGATAENRSVTGSGVNTAPTVTTVTASSISINSASSGGSSISAGCGTITAKGVVWGASANPTIPSANSTNDGSGTTNYTGSITGLSANTTYNYRAYTTNSNGLTSYGSNLTFTTLKLAPTTQASAITFTSIGSSVMTVSCTQGDGDGRIVLINTTNSFTNPTNGEAQTGTALYDGSGQQCVYSGAGNSVTVTGLSPTTTYWFRVYEYNNSGTNIIYKTEVATNNPLNQTTPVGPIAAWDFFGQSSPSTFAATTFNTNLVSTSNANEIIRGPGASSSSAGNSFRSQGFENNGISTSNTDYFQIKLTAETGYQLSLSTIDANFKGTGSFYATPGVTSQFAYSLNGTDFNLIGSPFILTGASDVAFLTMPQIDLSGIAALQDIEAGTTVTLRYYASGQTTTGGWGFYSTANGTNGLAIGGNVAAAGATILISTSTLTGLNSKYSQPSNEQSFTVSGTNLTENISIAAPTNYEISTTSGSGFGGSITLNQSGGSVVSTPIYVRLKAGLAFGSYNNEEITLTSTGATSKTVTCSGTVTIADPVATAATSVTSNSFIANWNAVAGADGYKIDVYKKTNSYATDLIISEYVDGVTGTNKAIEIFNGTGASVDLSNYRIWLVSNGGTWPETTINLTGSLAHNDVFVITNNIDNSEDKAYTNLLSSYNLVSGSLSFNGDDAIGLAKNIAGNWTLIDAVGTDGADPGTGWAVAGTANATADRVLTRKGTVVSPTTNWETSRGTTTTDSEWIVQVDGTNEDAAGFGSHSFSGGIVNTFLSGFENLPVTDTLKSVSGIASNTEYFYVVRAYNAYGTSNNSNEIQHVHYWTGATSSAWGVATNWSNGVVPVTDATIWLKSDASNNCALDANRSVTDIVIKSASNTLSANGHTLTIKGNIDNVDNAKIDATASGSTINFAGTATQTIGSNLFTSDQVQNLTINNAAGVIQNTDLTVSNVFTINAGKWYQINAAKALTVSGTVTNSAGADGLFIRAGDNSTANASFIYPQGQTVEATVEFYSKASWDKSAAAFSRYKWQYFGIPVSEGTHLKASPTFDGAFVRKFNETGVGAGISNTPEKRWLQLTNSSTLEPFAGYEIVQAAATNYYIQGTLVNSDFSSGQLTYSTTDGIDAPGSHIFSNPYTAAIDIQQLTFGSETEQAVYQFHTGSHNDWGGGTVNGESVGQYRVSPKSTAGTDGIPRYISSMQGFLIKKLNSSAPTSNFSFNIPYSAVKAKNTTAMRSPEQEKSYTTIDVTGNRFADKVWIFIDQNCSRAYDNGWDGRKLLGSVLTPQLLVREGQNDLQISAVDDINNTVLAFQPGEDAAYTLTFKHTNIVYPELYLLDAETNSVTDISATGSTYSFIATASTTPVERFKIVTGSNITTDNADITTDTKIFSNKNMVYVNNKSNCAGTLKLMDITGKMLLTKSIAAGAFTAVETTLAAGNYIALFENCERAFRQTILLK